MAKAPLTGLRLYGVAAEDHGRRAPVQGTELVPLRDLCAVVVAAPFAAPRVDDGELARYRAVVEGTFAQRTILPAPPGVTFRSRETLLHWLSLHYVALAEALAFVEGRQVARVHVARPAPVGGEPDPDPDPGVRAEAEHDLEASASEVFRALRRCAVALISVKPMGEEALPSTGASFLVERDRWAAFAAAVDEERQRFPDLTLDWTGPWPPYDFVRMQFGS